MTVHASVCDPANNNGLHIEYIAPDALRTLRAMAGVSLREPNGGDGRFSDSVSASAYSPSRLDAVPLAIACARVAVPVSVFVSAPASFSVSRSFF